MLELTRIDEWPERMAIAINLQFQHGFDWGLNDCGTLFAEVVKAMTGVDPMADFGVWNSEQSAMRCLAKTGCADMFEYVSQRFQQINPAEAGRGDLGYWDNRERLTCPAIITGSEAVSRNQSGVVVFSRSLITTAFRVG